MSQYEVQIVVTVNADNAEEAERHVWKNVEYATEDDAIVSLVILDSYKV